MTGRAARALRRTSPGFTLLEVLVAFVIAALALALLYQGGLGGLDSANAALRVEQALSRAQSHLAAAALGPDLAASDGQGDEGAGYHWRVRVMPMARAAGDPAQAAPALYAVTVQISWRQGSATRSVTLATQRTGAAPPAPP